MWFSSFTIRKRFVRPVLTTNRQYVRLTTTYLAANDRLSFESYHVMCFSKRSLYRDLLPSALHSRRRSPATEAATTTAQPSATLSIDTSHILAIATKSRYRSNTNRDKPSQTRGGEWGEQTLFRACSRAFPGSAMCVQNFDDSLNSAIRITYRISLRSSSLREPRYPSLKVVLHCVSCAERAITPTPTLCFRYTVAYIVKMVHKVI